MNRIVMPMLVLSLLDRRTIQPLFRQTCRAALAALAVLGGLTLANAGEPKKTGDQKQITNSIGTKFG
jgi:hypothetical protein